MGLPTTWTGVQVFGTYLRIDGTPNSGSVWFELDQEVQILDDGGVPIAVMPKRIVAELDANGRFSVVLPATDDTHITPTGWTYQVLEKFAGSQPPYSITVPAALASTGINLVQYPHAVPVPVDPPTVTYLTTADLGVSVGTQGDVTTAVSQSAVAVASAAGAVTTANTALNTANTASTNASAAVTTANSAVATANTASTNASTAVTTANTANTTASAAQTAAAGAVTTANTASTNASAAVTTANTANTNASAAVATANTASTNASNAVTTANGIAATANTALTNANAAVTTANAAQTTANAALPATSNAVSASKWATARTITLGTDASGSVSLDGSANVTLNATVSHAALADTATTATSAASATTAAHLTTARTLSLTGPVTGSATFDGSANAAIATTLTGYVPAAGGTFTGPVNFNSGLTASSAGITGGLSTVTLTASGALSAGASTVTTLAASGLVTASAGVSTTTLAASGLVTASAGISVANNTTVSFPDTGATVNGTGALEMTSGNVMTLVVPHNNPVLAVKDSAGTAMGNVVFNPMLAQFDMIVGDVSGVPKLLPAGGAGQYLFCNNTGPQWGMPNTSISSTGTTQGTANLLSPGINILTVSSTGTSGLLPASAAPGAEVIVQLRGTSASIANAQIYPPTGGTIDQLAANQQYFVQLTSITNATAVTPPASVSVTVKFTSLGSNVWMSSTGALPSGSATFVPVLRGLGTNYQPFTTFLLNNALNTLGTNSGLVSVAQDFGNQASSVTFQGAGLPVQRVTLTGNVTIGGNMGVASVYGVMRLIIAQDATGGRTVAWGANVLFSTAPTINAAANGITIVEFTYDLTTNKFYGRQVY